MLLQVRRQIIRRSEIPATNRTHVHLLHIHVLSHMNIQRGRLCELLQANVATERLLPRMRPLVLLQIRRPRKSSITHRTSEQILPCMRPDMLLQIRRGRELFVARYTREFFSGVFHHVRLQLGSVITNFVA